MMSQASFDEFNAKLEARLQAGNAKWDEMQVQLNGFENFKVELEKRLQ